MTTREIISVDTNKSQLDRVKMPPKKRFAEYTDEDINEKRIKLTPQATKVIIIMKRQWYSNI